MEEQPNETEETECCEACGCEPMDCACCGGRGWRTRRVLVDRVTRTFVADVEDVA